MRRIGLYVVIGVFLVGALVGILAGQRDIALVLGVVVVALLASSSRRRNTSDDRSVVGLLGWVACVLLGGGLICYSVLDESSESAVAGLVGTVLAGLGAVGLLMMRRRRPSPGPRR